MASNFDSTFDYAKVENHFTQNLNSVNGTITFIDNQISDLGNIVAGQTKSQALISNSIILLTDKKNKYIEDKDTYQYVLDGIANVEALSTFDKDMLYQLYGNISETLHMYSLRMIHNIPSMTEYASNILSEPFVESEMQLLSDMICEMHSIDSSLSSALEMRKRKNEYEAMELDMVYD